MSISKNTRNGLLTAGSLLAVKTNNPPQYATRQKRYFEDESTQFLKEYAKYSSDYFEAQVQGLDLDDPMGWRTVHIRMADIVKPSATLTHKFDESKIVIFAERDIDYVPEGTKIVTMGNTWLATNPANISSGSGQGVIDRCNAVWNFLDYYGNVISEPIVIKKLLASANDSDYQMGVLVTKGYFNIVCQYNDYTRQLDTNSRIILGTGAYRITGYSDFNQEFTGDYSKIRLLEFTARYDEPNFDIDDMENHVAGGKTFSWVVETDFKDVIKVGETVQAEVTSRRNNEIVTALDAPIDYIYESGDESIAVVDENGAITGVNEGTTTISTKLAQNTLYGTVRGITVEDTISIDRVEFTSNVPNKLTTLQSATITAAYFANGEEQSDTITWTILNADPKSYKAEINGNTIKITCYATSTRPMKLIASYGTYEVGTSIALQGI